MRTITILLAISCAHLSSFSQDTGSVCMPLRVARQVQQDLISKDSSEKMLGLAYEEIDILEKTIQYKDMVMDTLTSDCLRIKSMMENEKNMKLAYKGIAEDCKTQFDAANSKYISYRKFTKLVGFIGTAVIAGLTAIILLVK